METNFAFGEKYFILFASVILCFFRWQFQSMSDTLSTGLEAPKEDLISLLDPGVHILPPVKPACDLLFNFQRSICNQSTGSEWSEVEPAGHVRGEVQPFKGVKYLTKAGRFQVKMLWLILTLRPLLTKTVIIIST